MREYVLQEVRCRRAYGRLTGLVRLMRNWKTRNELKRLMAMDDYMLRDIGVSRAEVRRLSRLSLTADWQWEQEWKDLRQ